MASNSSVEAPLDVAIIGAGVAGLYSGWRLKSNSDRTVEIFESAKRIGGRLLSVTPPGMSSVVCELGGMRIISNQKYAMSLVKELGMPTKNLAASKPGNLSFLRGNRLKQGELKSEACRFYRLREAERNKSPGELLIYALEQLVPGVTKMTDAEYAETYRNYLVNGRHLYEQGFWNLLLGVLSNEAYNLVQDSSGYYSITTNWNAADAIGLCLGDFRPNTTYHGFPEGFEQMAVSLQDRFTHAGGKVQLEHTLVSFDSVALADGSDGVCLKIKDQKNNVIREVYARRLILALPRRSIELLSQTGSLLSSKNSEVHHLLRSVEPIPLFKLFVVYPQAWWENKPLQMTDGESITDLPLRQCYYWGTEGEQGVLLASYNDVRETRFWSGLRNSPGVDDHFENVVSDAQDNNEWQRHRAPRLMVDEIHRQLKVMHGVDYIPRPIAAAYRDWSEDPFGGGVHFWNLGYNSHDVRPKIARLDEEQPVYIVGEAYSSTQGWVEGALETSEYVLKNYFEMSDPAWLENSESL